MYKSQREQTIERLGEAAETRERQAGPEGKELQICETSELHMSLRLPVVLGQSSR